MTIKRAGIIKFRSIERVQLNFGPGTNILIGPNGSGKSSILMALTWGITGSCLHTSRDGRSSNVLALDGAKDMIVGLEIDGLGQIKRQRLPSTLSLSGHDGKQVLIQERIYDTLRVAPEAIRVLLDPEPLVRRTTTEQSQAMVKILRPAELRPTLRMKEQGITEIHGIEHLNLLHKQFKDDVLRDLNREGKRAESALKGDRPKWPFPGKEESHYIDNGKQLAEVRDRLSEKIGGLMTKRQGLVEHQGIAVEKVPSQEVIRDQKRKLEEVLEVLQVAEKELTVHNAKLNDLIGFGHQNKMQLENLADPVKCPAGDCPILADHHQQVKTQKAGLEASQEDLSKEYGEEKQRSPELEKAVESAQKENLKQGTKWAAIESAIALHRKLADLGIKDATQLEDSIKELDAELTKLRDQLSRCRGSLTRNDEALVRISSYHRDNEEISHRAINLNNLLDKGRTIRDVIKDIEGLQKDIVEVGIGKYLEYLHEFTDPFKLGEITYGWNTGFKINGRQLALDSGGRNQMIFEAGFRVAAAKILGLGFVFIDYIAPLTGENWARLVNGITKSGLQVILAYTAGKVPKVSSEGSFKGFWLSLEDGLTQVIEL